MVDGLTPIGNETRPSLIQQRVGKNPDAKVIIAAPQRQEVVCSEFAAIPVTKSGSGKAEYKVF